MSAIKIICLFMLTGIHLNASILDEYLKKQCENIVYGSGALHYEARGYLTGIVAGFDYILPISKQKKSLSQGDIRYMACKEALNSSLSDGFENKFKTEAYSFMKK